MKTPDPRFFGYFDEAGQESPAYDPGMTAPCIVCMQALTESPARAICMFIPGDSRSWFFRAHKTCWDKLSPEEQTAYESSMVDPRAAQKSPEDLKAAFAGLVGPMLARPAHGSAIEVDGRRFTFDEGKGQFADEDGTVLEIEGAP